MDVHRLVIVIGCFFTAFIGIGFVFSFGNLFGDVMETFDVSRSQAGSVNSITVAFGLGSGETHV